MCAILKPNVRQKASNCSLPRCSILQAARTAGIQAVDTVYSNANNEEGFLKEAALIKQLALMANP